MKVKGIDFIRIVIMKGEFLIIIMVYLDIVVFLEEKKVCMMYNCIFCCIGKMCMNVCFNNIFIYCYIMI